MDVINIELLNYYKKDVCVCVFLDLIEVKDEVWCDVLEGYLNIRCFDLIIDLLYFNDVFEVYDCVKNELFIYGVGLVNIVKIGEYIIYLLNLFVVKVIIDYFYVRNYVNMIMGYVVIVDNLSDLKNY